MAAWIWIYAHYSVECIYMYFWIKVSGQWCFKVCMNFSHLLTVIVMVVIPLLFLLNDGCNDSNHCEDAKHKSGDGECEGKAGVFSTPGHVLSFQRLHILYSNKSYSYNTEYGGSCTYKNTALVTIIIETRDEHIYISHITLSCVANMCIYSYITVDFQCSFQGVITWPISSLSIVGLVRCYVWYGYIQPLLWTHHGSPTSRKSSLETYYKCIYKAITTCAHPFAISVSCRVSFGTYSLLIEVNAFNEEFSDCQLAEEASLSNKESNFFNEYWLCTVCRWRFISSLWDTDNVHIVSRIHSRAVYHNSDQFSPPGYAWVGSSSAQIARHSPLKVVVLAAVGLAHGKLGSARGTASYIEVISGTLIHHFSTISNRASIMMWQVGDMSWEAR